MMSEDGEKLGRAPDPGVDHTGTARAARGAVRRATAVFVPSSWGCLRVQKSVVLRCLRILAKDTRPYTWRTYADGHLHVGSGPFDLYRLMSVDSACATASSQIDAEQEDRKDG